MSDGPDDDPVTDGPGPGTTDPGDPVEPTGSSEPTDRVERAEPAEPEVDGPVNDPTGSLASLVDWPPRDPAGDPHPSRRNLMVPVLVVFAAVTAIIGVLALSGGDPKPPPATEVAAPDTTTSNPADTAATVTESTLTPLEPYDGWVNPASFGRPWGDTVQGSLTFRGNPTRSWYGTGPVPAAPEIAWTYPSSGGMCGQSSDNGQVVTWCGTGWTGQPAVFERDGKTWVIFGAYDKAVHFLDADTGEELLPEFPVGDIIKGAVTVDPDGYPLVYTGPRDNYLRVVAFDGEEPRELWRLSAEAVSPTMWNDDWDGSPLIIDDYLFEGGENSQFHIVKLNRGYDAEGRVTVDPELVFNAPGWDQELLNALGDRQVSIENSVAISGNTVWFANSGGLLQGWDISTLKEGGTPTRTFRYWLGDDTDASVVVDEAGFLYVGVEYERGLARAKEVGQILKLDPSKPDDPIVWSVDDQGAAKAGIWATPAVWKDMVYVPTNGGRLLGIDRESGEIVWTKQLSGPTWQSSVVVDDVLIQGDCDGWLHGYDVSDTRVDPPELWKVRLDGCIESTPSVWKGRIYVGARGGQFYALEGDG